MKPEIGLTSRSSDKNNSAGPSSYSRGLYFEFLGENFEKFMDHYDVERRLDLIFSDLLGDLQLRERGVLEIGSGTGCISRQILRSGAKLTALDIGRRLVATVAQLKDCEGIVGDAIQLPFSDGSFDVVISSECIEHTTDPLGAIQEMCRVCRVGGVVCITTPNKLWYPVLLVSQLVGLRKFSGMENWVFPCQAARIMRRANMIGIRVSGVHLWPFQFRAGQRASRALDRWGEYLYPFMINFGVRGVKGL